MLLLKLYQRWSLTLARFKKCYHKFYVDPHNTIISKMVFFCQPRLTKTLSKQRKDNYPQGNLRINWKSFFFSSFFSKQKSSFEILFFFLFCNKSLWESFPAWKNKKEEKNVFVVIGHTTAFSPILYSFGLQYTPSFLNRFSHL